MAFIQELLKEHSKADDYGFDGGMKDFYDLQEDLEDNRPKAWVTSFLWQLRESSSINDFNQVATEICNENVRRSGIFVGAITLPKIKLQMEYDIKNWRLKHAAKASQVYEDICQHYFKYDQMVIRPSKTSEKGYKYPLHAALLTDLKNGHDITARWELHELQNLSDDGLNIQPVTKSYIYNVARKCIREYQIYVTKVKQLKEN